jgi:hypothetical protein
MKSFKTMVAVMGLSLFAVGAAQAGPHGHTSISNSGNGTGNFHSFNSNYHGFNSNYHGFNYNSHFDFGRYGVNSLNYSNRYWSNRYGCYQYWCPSSSCWYFYFPTYSCYIPWQYYSTVYPSVSSVSVPPAPVVSTPSYSSATATTSIPLTANFSASLTPGYGGGPIGPAAGPAGPAAGPVGPPAPPQ